MKYQKLCPMPCDVCFDTRICASTQQDVSLCVRSLSESVNFVKLLRGSWQNSAPVFGDNDIVFNTVASTLFLVRLEDVEIQVLGLFWVLLSQINEALNEVQSWFYGDDHPGSERSSGSKIPESRVGAFLDLVVVTANVMGVKTQEVAEAVRLENRWDTDPHLLVKVSFFLDDAVFS